MATPGMPDPNAGASPQEGAAPASPSPSQAPANPIQMLLAKWYQTAKELSASNPAISAGMQKVAEGIQEAQTAMVTGQAPPPASGNPPY